MYSFFQYTPVVNYGAEVDNTALSNHNICVDDGAWKKDGAWIDGGSWRDIGCGVNKCGELSTSLLYPVYPLHPESIVAEDRDERGVFINIGWKGCKRMG